MHTRLLHYRVFLTTYLAPQRRRVGVLAGLLLASTALQLCSPQLLRQFIDAAGSADAPIRALLTPAALFLLAALTTQIIQVAATYLSELVGWTATNRLRSDLTRHCLGLDRAFHTRRTPGEMIERIDGDITALATFFSQLVVQVGGSLLLLAGILAALFWESALVGALLTLFALAALAALLTIRSAAVETIAAEREARAGMFGLIEERLAGLDDLRANGGGDYAIQRLDDVTREVNRIGLRAAIFSLWIWIVTMGSFALGYALALGLGALLFLRGSVTIGTVFLFFQYTGMLRQPLEQLAEQIKQFQAAAASIRRVDELRALRPSIDDGPGHAPQSRRGGLRVEFRGVSFGYDSAATIDELSFTLEPGRVLGVLGRTGSGKTTLARLLVRQYDVQRGAILLDGIDLRELTLAQLRSRIGIVTQDVQLFEASVRDNLTLFDRSISDARVRAALDQIGLSAWLRSLPEGLEHVLRGGAAALAAGEAQLIALARVFLHDPELVILDEASSRLDPATERLIERAVDRLLRPAGARRTAIVIAHRLHTLDRADELLVLEHGRLLEHGPRGALAADQRSHVAALLRREGGDREVLA